MPAAAPTLLPHEWTLALTHESVKAHENVLARRTYTLTNPDAPDQVLWCYCDRRATPDGRGRCSNRYAASQAAGRVIHGLAQGDFAMNVFPRIFRQATRRKGARAGHPHSPDRAGDAHSSDREG